MKALRIQPVSFPEVIDIKGDLTSLQREVGGYIEVVYPWDDKVAIICDEEGKLNKKPLNRAIYSDNGEIYDVIAGTFLIVGLTEDSFSSLNKKQLEKYKAMFRKLEVWLI